MFKENQELTFARNGKRLFALLLGLLMIVNQFGFFGLKTVFADTHVHAAEIEIEEDDGLSATNTKAAGDLTVLAFTSDTHNKDDNAAANRLGLWLDKMATIYEKPVDLMAFGGDMANANASQSAYWTLTQADMYQLDQRNVTGVYTTGNHEHSPGNYSASSTDLTQKAFKINAEGAVGSNYRIYCLGSASSSSSYSSQVSSLTSYLNSVGNDKPIFIITHFPLHYFNSGSGGGWSWGGRTTSGASDIIDVLNNAVTNNQQKIVFLWGHNHTLSDTYYDYIYSPGYDLEYESGVKKTINFYYGAAGCMSDSEYGSGSASVKGKGLVITIDSQNKLSFTYYDANGNNVTEGGTYTEQEPVKVTGVTVSPNNTSVAERGSVQLTATVSPADATNKAVTWSSSDTNHATVDSTGKVRGVAEGSATITATTVDGGFVSSCLVTVSAAPAGSENTYILTETLEAGNEYLIANGNSGSVYIVSAEANGSRTLKGISVDVTDGIITLSDDEAEIAAFECDLENSSNANSTRLKNGSQYLYADSNNGLRMYTLSSSSDGKYWHYKADGKDLLWFFKGDDGYSDTSQTYKYYLECSNGNFTDNHVSTISLANSNTPKVYIFVKGDSTPASVTGVSLDKTSLTVSVGKTSTLTESVTPKNAGNKNVTWSSSNTSIATVENGVITAKAVGQTTITVRTEEGGFTATCTVTVNEAPEGNAYVLTDTLEAGNEYLIANGNSGNVYIVSTEANGSRTLKGVSVTVEDGTITLSENDAANVTFTCDLESSNNASSTRLKNGSQYLYADSNNGLRMYTLSSSSDGKYWHYKADGKDLLWFFKGDDGYSDTSQTYKYYLECDNGNFTDAHVSTTSLANTTTPTMYLFTRAVAANGVTLDKSSVDLDVGEVVKLTATVLPTNASNKKVTWSSSDTSVVTVSDGSVTGVGKGTAIITVTTYDGGFTATCAVNVTNEGKTYVLADKLEAGKEYLIASSNSGSAYIVTNEAGSAKQLKGFAVDVVDCKITISNSVASKSVFTSTANNNSAQNGLWLMNGDQYLYADSSNGLRLVASSTQTSSSNNAKSWHYKADNKNLLWFFKDTGSQDGYTDTSSTYKYYLTVSNGIFTDAHVSTTNLENTTTPAVYLFVKDDTPQSPHIHTYGEPTWTWAADYTSATATFTCTANDDTQTVTDNAPVEVVVSEATCTADKVVKYTAKVTLDEHEYTTESENVTAANTATGHTYGGPTWNWAEDYSSATATFTCTANDDVQTVAAAVSSETTEEGIVYTATVTFNDRSYEDSKTVVTYTFNGFFWNGYTAAMVSYTGSDNTTKTIKAEVTAETTEPTCTAAGKTVYTAAVTAEASPDGVARSDSKEVGIAALGHDWGEWVITKPATLTEAGEATHTCSRCNETETKAITKAGVIRQATASFEGKILLNFYLLLSDDVVADEEAYVYFTGGEQNLKILVSDATVKNASGETRYCFTYPVVAKELRNNINLRLYDGDGKEIQLTNLAGTNDYTATGVNYSLMTYCTKMLESSTSSQSMKDLAQATIDYGTAAQIYFDFNAEGLSVDERVTSVTPEELEQYKSVQSGSMPEGLTGRTITALFEEDNSLRIYFTYDSGYSPSTYTYTIDGKTASIHVKHGTSGDEYYLEVKGVPSNKLGKTHDLTISNGSTTYKITVSVLTYARSSVSNGTTDRQNLGKALYRYYLAAKAKFGE